MKHAKIIREFSQCRTCLLYADNTLLFLKPNRDQIAKINLIFQIFDQLSGLNINLSKSELSITSSTPFLTQALASVIQCKPVSLPTRYFGLLLSDRNLIEADYFDLIDKIQAKLSGWKASLLSIGGRIILINTVLSAIP